VGPSDQTETESAPKPVPLIFVTKHLEEEQGKLLFAFGYLAFCTAATQRKNQDIENTTSARRQTQGAGAETVMKRSKNRSGMTLYIARGILPRYLLALFSAKFRDNKKPPCREILPGILTLHATAPPVAEAEPLDRRLSREI